MDSLKNLDHEIVSCRKCPRLVAFRERVAREKRRQFHDWEYWGKPVPGFGDPNASLLIVGLAPAPHGGNRTGRIFTGDRSGDFLISALHKAGFASQSLSESRSDGLTLRNAYLTAAVKCAPPDNKPAPVEVGNCSPYLSRELDLLKETRVILCLGQLAFNSVMDTVARHQQSPRFRHKFAHGLEVSLGLRAPTVFASYHPSPRNTQTGKLTREMFLSLLARVQRRLRKNPQRFARTVRQNMEGPK
ncbi:uracil-DNA glycosylase [Candidatus Bathyarchaeota archaeon]|nr:MAG: uracil-DNA glycosylase [Candidatus Bathyarchaeota archaeon]TMI32794.1 MAG: uracil-DNA glycosylase [Candidatus Bathyarchaeota archaeon]